MTSFMTHSYLFDTKNSIAHAILVILALPVIWALPKMKLKILKVRRFFGDIDPTISSLPLYNTFLFIFLKYN